MMSNLNSLIFGTLEGRKVGIMVIKAFPLGIALSVRNDSISAKQGVKSCIVSIGVNTLKAFCLDVGIQHLFQLLAHCTQDIPKEDDILSRTNSASITLRNYAYNSIPYHLSVFLIKSCISFVSFGLKIMKQLNTIKTIKSEEERDFYMQNFHDVVSNEFTKVKRNVLSCGCICCIMMILETLGATLSSFFNPSLCSWNSEFKPMGEVYYIF